jgi:quercetin dioxygenase-like cupin family protein
MSKSPMHRILSFLFIGMMTIVPAAAQQPKPSANETFRSLLQNEQVSVKEMRLRPGAKIPPATYPNSFIYGLTDGAIVYTLPGKTPFEITFRAGEAVWIPSQLTATANETDKEIRALVVEIKAKPPVAAKSRSKASAKPAKPKK